MKLVYIAGPYRGTTHLDVEANILAARQAGAAVARLGALPIIPHSNTGHLDDVQNDDFWLNAYLALLARCDAIMVLRGWQISAGTKAEMQRADQLGIRVFYYDELDQLADYLRDTAPETV